MGRCGTEGPPSPAGDPSLEVTTLRAALSPCIPGQNQHRTEHIPGRIHLAPLPFHIKANQTSSQRPTLFSSVHTGTLAQAQPILAWITLWRIKHPMYTAKSCTACAPGTWVWPSSAPCPSQGSERDKWGLPSISTKEINRCWGSHAQGTAPCLLLALGTNSVGKQSAPGWSLPCL